MYFAGTQFGPCYYSCRRATSSCIHLAFPVFIIVFPVALLSTQLIRMEDRVNVHK